MFKYIAISINSSSFLTLVKVEPGKLYTVSKFRRLKIQLAVPLGFLKKASHSYVLPSCVSANGAFPAQMCAGHQHLLSTRKFLVLLILQPGKLDRRKSLRLAPFH